MTIQNSITGRSDLHGLRLALVSVLCVLFSCFGVLAQPTIAAGAVTPWAVIKCKFSDQPQEPFFEPAFITGTYGMAGYWSDVSYGNISLSGTTIYGWYTLPFTLAEAQAFSPGTRRAQIINGCIAVARANGLDTSQFYSEIAIVNAQIDSGSQAGRVLLDPFAWYVSFAAHEMGHGYGLEHSYDDSGIDYGCPGGCFGDPGVYGDGWDIMSFGIFGNNNPTFTGVNGQSGPGVNAPNLVRLGWLPANRIVTWNGPPATVTLAALNRPFVGGYLMAKVPLDAANHYYTIEFRRKTDWDQGIPQNTVLIHEARTDGLFYLIRGNGGPERLPGQTFRDTTNNLAITVLGIDDASATATVNIGKNEVWVDFSYNGFFQFGTFDQPYDTLVQGRDDIASYGTVLIKGNHSSAETLTIANPMTLVAIGGPATIGH